MGRKMTYWDLCSDCFGNFITGLFFIVGCILVGESTYATGDSLTSNFFESMQLGVLLYATPIAGPM